jgi:hypothetical protein
MAIVKQYKIESGGTAVTFTSGDTHLVTGLTPSTEYDFYVRNHDDVSLLSSAWIGPETETTDAGSFSPADIFDHWYPVSMMTPLADNDPVTTLEDQSGAIDFTAAGGARPLYRTNAGDPYLQFDGSDDVMSAAEAGGDSDISLFMIVTIPADGPDYGRFFDAAIPFALFATTSIGRHMFATMNGSGSDYASFPAAATEMAIYVEATGTAVKLRLNGVETLGTGAAPAGLSSTWRLGGLASADYRQMNLKDLALTRSVPTGPEFTSLAAWVLSEYGLTL